jgi:hypothetical protein
VRIDTVEFDEHNEEHATRHGVSLVEIVPCSPTVT